MFKIKIKEDNMLFEFVTDIQENKNSQIYDLSEGFTKGNMFVNPSDAFVNGNDRMLYL